MNNFTKYTTKYTAFGTLIGCIIFNQTVAPKKKMVWENHTLQEEFPGYNTYLELLGS